MLYAASAGGDCQRATWPTTAIFGDDQRDAVLNAAVRGVVSDLTLEALTC
jgi:hypothetical protein